MLAIGEPGEAPTVAPEGTPRLLWYLSAVGAGCLGSGRMGLSGESQHYPDQVKCCLVGDTGIEPVTSSVSRKRASPCANRPRGLSPSLRDSRWRRDSNPCKRICSPLPRLSATPPNSETGLRADDGIRTRDPHLGKVMLYQLSHVRS